MSIENTIAQAIDQLVAADTPVSLDKLASDHGFDTTYFQKAFTSYAGVSPAQLARFLTYRRARDIIENGAVTTLETAYEAGISGNGRLHDLFVTIEAATPGEVMAAGKGMDITYGFGPSPFGELIVARTRKGICWVGFQVDASREKCLGSIKAIWPKANFIENSAAVAADIANINAVCTGKAARGMRIPLHLFGTNFRLQIWQALLKIPANHYVSYEALGAAAGHPGKSRAVGNAVGANPVSLLIPCHRVLQKTGIINHYNWGSARKKVLLGLEAGQTSLL